MLIVTREYNHKDFKRIGGVRLEADIKSVTLDGKVLSDDSVEYLLNFALQSLQDAYAGAKTVDEARAGWEKKYNKLVDGTIGVRGGGEVVDDVTKVARSIMRDLVRKKDKELWKRIVGMEKAEQDAKIDELCQKNADVIKDDVATEVARLRKERAKRAALADAVSFEL